MADEQPPIFKLMYGVKFRLQKNVNPRTKEKKSMELHMLHMCVQIVDDVLAK
jgi:hypothetical protein